jgi:hypothetical protein
VSSSSSKVSLTNDGEEGWLQRLLLLVPSSSSGVANDDDDDEGSQWRLLQLVMPPQAWSETVGVWNRKRGVEQRLNSWIATKIVAKMTGWSRIHGWFYKPISGGK